MQYGSSGLKIAVATPPVSPRIIGILRGGLYEALEAQAVAGMLEADEVVLELGSGIGLISTVVMASGKAREVHCFEADQRLIPLIRASHKANGITNAVVHNEIVTADPGALAAGYADLRLEEYFFANALDAGGGGTGGQRARVKTADIAGVLKTVRPTVIIADIEGAELGLFAGVDLSSVRRMLLELHPAVIGDAGIRSVFDDLHKAGFAYDCALSSGPVAGFVRVSG